MWDGSILNMYFHWYYHYLPSVNIAISAFTILRV